MSYLAAKQPDGKYAIFSTTTDSFIYTECTRDEVFSLLTYEYRCSSPVAIEKIYQANNDVIPFTLNSGNGRGRWMALSGQNEETLRRDKDNELKCQTYRK